MQTALRNLTHVFQTEKLRFRESWNHWSTTRTPTQKTKIKSKPCKGQTKKIFLLWRIGRILRNFGKRKFGNFKKFGVGKRHSQNTSSSFENYLRIFLQFLMFVCIFRFFLNEFVFRNGAFVEPEKIMNEFERETKSSFQLFAVEVVIRMEWGGECWEFLSESWKCLVFSLWRWLVLVSKSSILTPLEKQNLKKQLKVKNQNWKLVYRSSRDGGNGKKFHEMCDKIAPILVIIHSKKWAKISQDKATVLCKLRNFWKVAPTFEKKHPNSTTFWWILCHSIWRIFSCRFFTRDGKNNVFGLVAVILTVAHKMIPNKQTQAQSMGLETHVFSEKQESKSLQKFRSRLIVRNQIVFQVMRANAAKFISFWEKSAPKKNPSFHCKKKNMEYLYKNENWIFLLRFVHFLLSNVDLWKCRLCYFFRGARQLKPKPLCMCSKTKVQNFTRSIFRCTHSQVFFCRRNQEGTLKNIKIFPHDTNNAPIYSSTCHGPVFGKDIVVVE